MSRRPSSTTLAIAATLLVLAACMAGADARDSARPDPWPGVWTGSNVPDPANEFQPARFDAPRADDCHARAEVRDVPGRTEAAPQDSPDRPMGVEIGSSPIRKAGKASPGSAAVASPGPMPSMPAMRSAPLVDSFAARSEEAPSVAESREPRQRVASPRPIVTAGMVDDNADFGGYLAYRQRHPGLAVRDRDIGERYLLEVTDAAGRPVADAEVALQRPNTPEPLMRARTDTAGQVWLHPRAFLAPTVANETSAATFGIAARKGTSQGRAVLRRGQSHSVQLRLDGVPGATPARLDLVFLVDATGSMGDEIAKLKASMRAMSQQIAQLPSRPDICWALVAYRDRGDAFLTRTLDFTDSLATFQQQLARVQAAGGGDTPEALNEALHETVHGLQWRRDAVRLVVLVADAPPHLDYGGPQYDIDMQAALGKGIKVFAIGASGLDPVGEYVFRQIAQYTAGRFVFLTYRDAADPGSGPGSQTVHDVNAYSVQTLDRLVVRLVGEELGRLKPG